MKKSFIITYTLLLLLCAENSVLAAAIEKMAVFPVNVTTAGSMYSIYPDTLNLIAGDIVNTLTKDKIVSVIDLESSEEQIKLLKIEKQYKKLLVNYKNSYTLDYNLCALIANKLGISKMLLVSGGFDLQDKFLKRSLLYKLDIPGAAPMISSYRLNISLALIDTQSGLIEWEDTYKKDINISNFNGPSQYFGENVVPIEKIKDFSRFVSSMASGRIGELMLASASMDVKSSIVTQNSKTTDGSMTTDGHLNSSSGDYALNFRKKNYKNWIKKYLP